MQSYKRFASIPFLFIPIAITTYLWINGRAHFPDWDSSYGQIISVYLVMMIVFLVWSGRKTQEQMRRPLHLSATAFVIFFIGTYLILFALSALGVIMVDPLPANLFWQTVIFQVCVVATAEELMFRGVALEMLGVVVSAVLFAFWHSFAYGAQYYNFTWETFNWFAFAFAFIMGIILGIIAKQKQWSLPACIGVHSAYNLFVIGAFYAL